LQELTKIHGDIDMARWQTFSVQHCAEQMQGPRITLPTLPPKAARPGRKLPPKGRYASTVVVLPGTKESSFSGRAPSFLEVTGLTKYL
jgi:hypothetical protein